MKLKNLIREYAKEKGIPYKVAFIVITATWRETYHQTQQLDKYNIKVPGLGMFELKHWKADAAIERCKRAMEDSTDTDYYTDTITKLEHVKEMAEEEKGRRGVHREIKQQYRLNKLLENGTDKDITEGLGE